MLHDKLQEVSKRLSRVENQIIIGNDNSRTNKLKGCVIVQTCDAYQEYWDSFLWSFDRYWDKSIGWDLFFCNEEISFEKKYGFKQLLTGKGSHSQRLSKILNSLKEYDYVFYMLEDFWLTDHMTKELFLDLFKKLCENNWDALRVAPYMPEYYKLESTNHFVKNRRILKYSKDSSWKFSQQASFWKRSFLQECVVEPETSEKLISSSLSGEIAMDKYLSSNYPEAEIYHYHYYWYPVSGTVWRGKLTLIGEQINFIKKVEEILDQQY